MTEKCVLVIELPIDNFIVSNSHGIDCKVVVSGREFDTAPYVKKTFDASPFTRQKDVESK